MSKQVYITNTSHGNLSLKAGYIHIKVGAYTQVYEDELDSPDFRDALRKGWITVSEGIPEDRSNSTEPTYSAEPNSVALDSDQVKELLAKKLQEQSPLKTVVTKLGATEEPNEPIEQAAKGRAARQKAAQA